MHREGSGCILACDLDNTLIYSRRHFHDGWPCVEWIHEKEQAYMSPETIRLLREANARMTFLPVTSRSIEQYRRLAFPEGCEPDRALCTNGAVLLCRGEPDPGWKRETDRMLDPWREELQRMERKLSPSGSFIRCRIVDDAYLFVYCAADVSPRESAAAIQQETELYTIASGKKIYLLPPFLNKGTALERFTDRLGQDMAVIAAGDGEMDVPMLKNADLAICPAGLLEEGKENIAAYPSGMLTLFSEYALMTALNRFSGLRHKPGNDCPEI